MLSQPYHTTPWKKKEFNVKQPIKFGVWYQHNKTVILHHSTINSSLSIGKCLMEPVASAMRAMIQMHMQLHVTW